RILCRIACSRRLISAPRTRRFTQCGQTSHYGFEFLGALGLAIKLRGAEHLVEEIFYADSNLLKPCERVIKVKNQRDSVQISLPHVIYCVVFAVGSMRFRRLNAAHASFGRSRKRLPYNKVNTRCVLLICSCNPPYKLCDFVFILKRVFEMPL